MTAHKLKLTFLLTISLVPIVMATLYFRASLENGVNTRSGGVLIQPLLELSRLDLRNTQGERAYLGFDELVEDVDPREYQPRPWQLLFMSSTDCDQSCIERLYFLRQIHLRLGREADRVQRALVVVDDAHLALPQATLDILANQQQDLRLLRGNPQWLLQELAPSAQGRNPVQEHFIYVADPVGNIMLYFTPENTPEEILKDIDKLLDQSSLG